MFFPNKVLTDVQETTTDMAGVIVYSLEADQVAVGTLKFEITYNDDLKTFIVLPPTRRNCIHPDF